MIVNDTLNQVIIKWYPSITSYERITSSCSNGETQLHDISDGKLNLACRIQEKKICLLLQSLAPIWNSQRQQTAEEEMSHPPTPNLVQCFLFLLSSAHFLPISMLNASLIRSNWWVKEFGKLDWSQLTMQSVQESPSMLKPTRRLTQIKLKTIQ